MKDSGKSIEEVSQLSAREIAQIRKRYALHRKYEEALNLYATFMPIQTQLYAILQSNVW